MRPSETIATYSDLKARARHNMTINGPYLLTKTYIELPIKMLEGNYLVDGTTWELESEATVEVKDGSLVDVVINPRLYSAGLATTQPVLTSAISGPRPVVVRLEVEGELNLEDIDYIARLYMRR